MLEANGVKLVKLDAQALERVAEIHAAAFADSALTQLGKEAVRRYYEWQLTGPHDSIALGCEDQGELAGFCFAGRFRGAMSGFLNRNRSYLAGQIITHPWLLANGIIRQRMSASFRILRRNRLSQSKSLSAPRTGNYFSILSIAVYPAHQGRGLGKLLMEAAESLAIEKGCSELYLTVHESNTPAIGFYESLGWHKVLSNGTWRGGMAKEIKP